MRRREITFSHRHQRLLILTRQRGLLTRSFAICVFAFLFSCDLAAQTDSNLTPSSVIDTLNSGEITDALQQAIELDDAAGSRLSDVDTTLMLMQVARGFQKSGDNETAAKLCKRAIKASKRPAADSLTAKQNALVQLAAGTTLFKAGNLSDATEALADSINPDAALNNAQQKVATKLLIQIGGKALKNKNVELATNAYGHAAENGVKDLRATAMLGKGWALASDGKDHPNAAQVLNDFVQEYPDHPDTARAAVVCARCWQKSYRNDKADELAELVFGRWPDSSEAMDLMQDYISLPDSRLPKSAQQWLENQIKDDKTASLDPAIAAVALFIEFKAGNSDRVDLLAKRIAESDQKGDITLSVLKKHTENGQSAEAQRLAANFTSKDANTTIAAQEAVFRWAAAEEQWQIIALASEHSKPSENLDSRSIAIERLFAESLMQTARVSEAQIWWDHLVDVRNDTAFSTQLRCAETATANSDVTTAGKRIAAAQLAAANAPQATMVQMLSAELSIRKLEFDAARTTLASVVENPGAVPTVRARAQWLIGETFFMQRDFLQAIEEYRKVDSIVPDGQWSAASIIQAGKSFEQLGRTQEAKVCYQILQRRFADSPHAPLARRRLAAINPDSSTPNNRPIQR